MCYIYYYIITSALYVIGWILFVPISMFSSMEKHLIVCNLVYIHLHREKIC